jgi:hypothetical protein
MRVDTNTLLVREEKLMYSGASETSAPMKTITRGLAATQLLTVGCSAQVDGDGAARQSEAVYDPPIPPIHYHPPVSPIPQRTEYGWISGSAPTIMFNPNIGPCVLTGVEGQFTGWGDSVTITAPNNGPWQLGGTTQGGDAILGTAECVPWSTFTHDVPNLWYSGNWWLTDATGHGNTPGLDLWGADSFCYLTGVRGRADAWMDIAWLDQPGEDSVNGWPGWKLNVIGGPDEHWGSAACFKFSSASKTVYPTIVPSWAQTLNGGNYSVDDNVHEVALPPASQALCGLTEVAGYILGGSVFISTASDGTRTLRNATPSGTPGYPDATAVCVNYYVP